MKGHYYAVDPGDVANAICSNGNVLEGVACYVYDPTLPQPSGTVPFYRLHDKVADFRFYTANVLEDDQLLQNQQQFAPDGIVGYVYWPDQPAGIATSQLYRLRNTQTNEHLYTTSDDEYRTLLGLNSGATWADESPACYVFNPGQARALTVPLYRMFKNF